MNERFHLKYKKILDILPDVAECTGDRLVLIGGTALALFHAKHRISVDLDFVALEGDESEAKEMLKGCMTKKGYKTQRSAFQNQFVIQFEDSAIKVEVLSREHKVKKIEKHPVGNAMLLVASAGDILELKKSSYSDRRAARDLFDIYFLLKDSGSGVDTLRGLVRLNGPPRDIEEMEGMVLEHDDYESFKKVVEDASKTGN